MWSYFLLFIFVGFWLFLLVVNICWLLRMEFVFFLFFVFLFIFICVVFEMLLSYTVRSSTLLTRLAVLKFRTRRLQRYQTLEVACTPSRLGCSQFAWCTGQGIDILLQMSQGVFTRSRSAQAPPNCRYGKLACRTWNRQAGRRAGMRLINFNATALEFARLTCAAFNIRLTTYTWSVVATGSGNAGTCEKLHDRSRIRFRQKAGVCASSLRLPN
jgi:hypothetical protein